MLPDMIVMCIRNVDTIHKNHWLIIIISFFTFCVSPFIIHLSYLYNRQPTQPLYLRHGAIFTCDDLCRSKTECAQISDKWVHIHFSWNYKHLILSVRTRCQLITRKTFFNIIRFRFSFFSSDGSITSKWVVSMPCFKLSCWHPLWLQQSRFFEHLNDKLLIPIYTLSYAIEKIAPMCQQCLFTRAIHRYLRVLQR